MCFTRRATRVVVSSIFFFVTSATTTAQAAGETLAFTSPPQTVRAGAASGPFVVGRQDAAGSPIGAGLPAVTVTLTSSSPRGQFAMGPEPSQTWTPAISVTIPQDASAAPPVFYRDGAAGTAMLTASATGYLSGSTATTIELLSLVDSFESGTLLPSESPPGPWNASDLSTAPNPVGAVAAAAHRGQLGLRVSDVDPSTGSGGQNAVIFSTAPLASTWYARAWFRLTSSNDLGSIIVMHVGTPDAASYALVDVNLHFPGPNLRVGAYDRTLTYTTDTTPVNVPPGGWHLIEVAVSGMGTKNGTRSVWLDGALAGTRSGIDWSTFSVGGLAVGESFAGARSFTGDLDFDDVQASLAPLPSRLALTAPASAAQYSCVPLTVTLEDSLTAAPAAAAYVVQVALASTAVPGAFFADAACANPASTVTVPPGASSATAWFRATGPGAASISASHADLLGATASVTINPSPALSITPASAAVAPRGSVPFVAAGGSGSGYQWSFAANASGGTIGANGAYVAGSTGAVSDVIRLTDGASNTITATVDVGPALAIAPASASTQAGTGFTFTASGGQPPYAWSLTEAPSGGTVDASTGAYLAGGRGGVIDSIRVTDSLGSTSTASVSVTAPIENPPPPGRRHLAVGCAQSDGVVAALAPLIAAVCVRRRRRRSS